MATSKKRYSFYRPHERVQKFNVDDFGVILPSMTKQEFARECDINNIVKAFSVTGQWNHISAKAASGAYVDLPDAIDLQVSLQVIQEANTAFMSLPAHVRDRFHNEPANFLEFVNKPENLAEMRKMGLAPEAPREDPPKAPVQEPPPSKPDA